MLKYKLNIRDKKNELIEVKYESLFLSEDCTLMSGVTDPSYGLSEEQTITVVNGGSSVCSLSAHDVMRCGYVIYNKSYKVQDFDDVIGILYNDGQYYCVSKDYWKKEIEYESETILSDSEKKLINPFIKINNKEYELGVWVSGNTINWYDEIIIPTKYWAYDEKINIDNVIYDVIIDEKNQLQHNENYYPYIILNDMSKNDIDRILYVMDWEYSKRKKVTLFTITSSNDVILHITENHCMKRVEYFNMTGNDGNVYQVYSSDFDTKNEFWENLLSNEGVLSYEWKKVNKSNFIDIYVNENVVKLTNKDFIEVTPINSINTTLKSKKYENGILTFEYYGKEYYCDVNETEKYLNINGVEYKIINHYIKKIENGNETEINQPYIVFNNTPISIILQGNKGTFKTDKNSSFDVISYPLIEINGIKYKVYEENKNNNLYYYYINNVAFPPFKLQIVNIFGNNGLRCKPLDYGDDLSILFSSMSNDINGYYCVIKNQIFNKILVSPISQEDKDYINDEIILLVNHNSFIIPLSLEKKNALNLHQSYVTHNNFVQRKKEESINRIVDMEKDIYYPAYLEKKAGEDILTLCHQIQIDLHFRTRDLSTWVINEDVANYENNGMGDDKWNKYPNNWNIFDYYRYPIDKTTVKSFQPLLKLNGDNAFYPPSDLLYFLNFTNEDVFYQKQKIGKSFLRLSFFDSPNPQNQNLLYTTTIFMSETLLFQKYINADKTLTNYTTLKERGYNREKVIGQSEEIKTMYNVDNLYNVSHIGVDTEPCENKTLLSFNEEKRLSSAFVINNRNEAIDSSEGFYLYLFKEFSNGLHERSIYMRVQFNHAGLGKTVNFMQMYNKHTNGEKSMINWSSKYNFDKYKDGCPLNELYEHLYIEIKVKYDIKNHRFCYYLPKWMSEKNSDKHTMRLCLFEVKIKDESEYKL